MRPEPQSSALSQAPAGFFTGQAPCYTQFVISRPYSVPEEHRPCVDLLVTEDEAPVDNMFCEKQQPLLVQPLFSSWERAAKGDFIACVDVGIFATVHDPPLVPDVFLSLDVDRQADPWVSRSYFIWEHGKPPDVVIEIVSNRKGGEQGRKHRDYARMGVPYYVVFDPMDQLGLGVLQVLELDINGQYRSRADYWLERVGLGLTFWEGIYQGFRSRWLRWCQADGSLLPLADETAEIQRQRADTESLRAEAEFQRAEAEKQRAEAERRRAERLAERLRAAGLADEEPPE